MFKICQPEVPDANKFGELNQINREKEGERGRDPSLGIHIFPPSPPTLANQILEAVDDILCVLYDGLMLCTCVRLCCMYVMHACRVVLCVVCCCAR